MNDLPTQYLDRKKIIEKYSFLTKNMLKNLLSKNFGDFRSKVVRRIGRRLIFDEAALLRYLASSKDGGSSSDDSPSQRA